MCDDRPNTIRIGNEYYRVEEAIKALRDTIAPMRECTVVKVLQAVAPDFTIIAYRNPPPKS